MPDSILNSAVFSLALVLKFHEKNLDPQSLAHELSGKEDAIGFHDLVRVARRLGMKARSVSVQPAQLVKAPRVPHRHHHRPPALHHTTVRPVHCAGREGTRCGIF